MRVGFAGTNWWAAQALGALVDEPGPRDRASCSASPTGPPAGAARRRRRRSPSPPRALGLELAQPERAAEALPLLQARGVQAVAVVAYGLLVPRALLDALPFVNLHPSALPRWRGAAPIERALMAGEPRVRRRGDAARGGARRRPGGRAGALRSRARRRRGRGLRARARARPAAARARAAPLPRAGGWRPCRRSARRPTPPRSRPPTALLDPRARRASCTTACGRSRRTSARGSSLDGAPHTIWRTRVPPRGPALGHARARRRRRRARLRRRARSSCASCSRRAAAACRRPTGCAACAARCRRRRARERRPHARAARAHARASTRAPTPIAPSRARPRRRKVDARERALAMHLAFGAVQRRRTLDAALEELAKPPGAAARAAARARPAARRLPDPVRRRNPAACSGFRERRARAARDRPARDRASRTPCCGASRAEGPEWYAALPEETPDEAALRHSLPDWIAELWFDAYGDERARALCAAANRAARAVALAQPAARRRARPWSAWLREAGVDGRARRGDRACCAWTARSTSRARRPSRAARSCRSRARPCWSPSASARGPGMRVLDLCAAPGGKTAVLAATGAQVTAVDAHPARAKTLGSDAPPPRRRGRGRRRPTAAPTRGGPFDRILVDAPCSGLGVLAGRPDSRWRRTPEDTDELAALQVELVAHARDAAGPRGRAPLRGLHPQPAGERGDRARQPASTAHDELRTWPDEGDDGFYAARLG